MGQRLVNSPSSSGRWFILLLPPRLLVMNQSIRRKFPIVGWQITLLNFLTLQSRRVGRVFIQNLVIGVNRFSDGFSGRFHFVKPRRTPMVSLSLRRRQIMLRVLPKSRPRFSGRRLTVGVICSVVSHRLM